MKNIIMTVFLVGILFSNVYAYQSSVTIPNGTGQQVLDSLNTAFQAVVTNNSGSSAPSPTYPNQIWVDTSVTPKLLKIRNTANSTWITLGSIDESLGKFLPNGATASADFATNSTHATNADYATAAGSAGTCTSATSATSCTNATNASNATNSDTVDYQHASAFQQAATAINVTNVGTAVANQFSNALSATGSSNLPGGLQFRWGTTTQINAGVVSSITYNTPFAHTTFGVACGVASSTGADTLIFSACSASGCTVTNNGNGPGDGYSQCSYFAWGY